MASFNRVILVGNLTRDIELRYTPSQMAVTDIGLAVNDRRKNQQGEWIEETTFVDITLWGRTAEVASEYLKKGSNVLIEGRLKLDSWTGNDGQKKNKLRVVGEKMQMLGAKGGGGGGRGPSSYDESEYSPPSDEYGAPVARAAPAGGGGGPASDDIPF